MTSLRLIGRFLLAPGVAALLLAVLPLTALASGSATIRDNAGLFTNSGRDSIQRAAQDADLRVLVITNNQSFSSVQTWRSWLQSQVGDSGTLTIGLHARRGQQDIYSVAGSRIGISQSQVQQAVHSAVSTFKGAGATAGVVQVIQNAHSLGAAAPDAATSSGIGWGWLIPVLIIVLLLFAAWRLFGQRRRYTPSVGATGGPSNQYGGPYPGYGGPGPGWFGGRPGWGGGGFLSGLLGGLGGAWLGNQLFGGRNRGVDAGGYDQNVGGPADTQDAQSMQGGWTDNSGNADPSGWTDNSNNGGWGNDGGNGGDNSGWTDNSGDNSGWGDAGGGGDWGNSGDGGQWT